MMVFFSFQKECRQISSIPFIILRKNHLSQQNWGWLILGIGTEDGVKLLFDLPIFPRVGFRNRFQLLAPRSASNLTSVSQRKGPPLLLPQPHGIIILQRSTL